MLLSVDPCLHEADTLLRQTQIKNVWSRARHPAMSSASNFKQTRCDQRCAVQESISRDRQAFDFMDCEQ